MSNPFFSVIVPCHNSAEFMRKGLDSIVDQDFDDYELLMVCDRCEDDTDAIAMDYVRTNSHDRVMLVDYGRAGLSRNAALDVARGEWVLFMDDDDWYLPSAFQAIHDELTRQTNIDILAYGFEWKGRGPTLQNKNSIKTAVWNKAWRREFIGAERFPDWIHTDDLGFARKMHPKARFGFLPMILYYYNFMRPGSVSDRIRDGE
ncbi:MAG: glycosyltransferase family 2 protein, partial [Oscillospiraceae bacterium]|nr:glycosyltransferase family 2 protein [Oscillospiraceae bacterium]